MEGENTKGSERKKIKYDQKERMKNEIMARNEIFFSSVIQNTCKMYVCLFLFVL